MKEMRYHHRQSITEARVISEYKERTIIILDVDEEVIREIPHRKSQSTIELIYNPPSRVYPGGHYGRLVGVSNKNTTTDYNLLYAALDDFESMSSLKKNH